MEEAVRSGNIYRVQQLINQGSEEDYDDVMSEAAEAGHMDIVQLMLQTGATGYGQHGVCQAILRAARGGHMNIVQLMLDMGATDYDEEILNEVMLEAAEGGHIDIVERMLQLGADDYLMGMEMAEDGGHMDIVEFLKHWIVMNHSRRHRDNQGARMVEDYFNVPYTTGHVPEGLIGRYLFGGRKSKRKSKKRTNAMSKGRKRGRKSKKRR